VWYNENSVNSEINSFLLYSLAEYIQEIINYTGKNWA